MCIFSPIQMNIVTILNDTNDEITTKGIRLEGPSSNLKKKPLRQCLLGKKGLKTTKHPYGISKINPTIG